MKRSNNILLVSLLGLLLPFATSADEEEGAAGSEETDSGGFSGAFFGFFVDLAGFGDKILRVRSEGFRPPELQELPETP